MTMSKNVKMTNPMKVTFERICLSRFLGYPTGEYLKPESWRCSMIWSATMGLPLSLEGVTNQKAL